MSIISQQNINDKNVSTYNRQYKTVSNEQKKISNALKVFELYRRTGDKVRGYIFQQIKLTKEKLVFFQSKRNRLTQRFTYF